MTSFSSSLTDIKRRFRSSALTIGVGLFALLIGRDAHAANEEDAFVTNDSILLGGAARTTVEDGGAAWLNPSRVAAIRRLSVGANISAARIHNERVFEAVTINGDEARTLHLKSLALLPASMSAGMSVSERVSLAFGMFVSRTAATSQSIVLEHEEEGLKFRHVTNYSNREQDYNIVAAVGWQAKESSQYGMSLIMRYGRQVFHAATWNLLDYEQRSENLVATRSEQLTRLGVGVLLGGTWQVRRTLAVSGVIQTPMLMLIDVENSTAVMNRTIVDGLNSETETTVERTNSLTADARATGTFRLHTGVAWSSGPRTLSGELELRFEPAIEGPGYESVWNARLGMTHDLNKGWTIGGGVFSDITQKVSENTVFGNTAQYGGVSFGARNRRFIELGQSERARTIERSSYIGARYLVGVGNFTGLNVDFNRGVNEPRRVPFVGHELSIYFGSSMAF